MLAIVDNVNWNSLEPPAVCMKNLSHAEKSHPIGFAKNVECSGLEPAGMSVNFATHIGGLNTAQLFTGRNGHPIRYVLNTYDRHPLG